MFSISNQQFTLWFGRQINCSDAKNEGLAEEFLSVFWNWRWIRVLIWFQKTLGTCLMTLDSFEGDLHTIACVVAFMKFGFFILFWSQHQPFGGFLQSSAYYMLGFPLSPYCWNVFHVWLHTLAIFRLKKHAVSVFQTLSIFTWPSLLF